MIGRHYGLIGYPLSHSLSREIYQHIFKRDDIPETTFELFPLKDLSRVRNFIENDAQLMGLNITIPYKRAIIQHLDKINEDANKIGAVNCVRIERKDKDFILTGFNTDKPAFVETLRPLLKSHHQKALVLGNGGAARAVAAGLNELEIGFTIVSRQPGQEEISYSALKERDLSEFQIIINTTPLGMYPEISGLPDIPYNQLTPSHFLYDLVYNPETTAFLQKGIDAGATTINGLPMLRRQAELSWKIWQ